MPVKNARKKILIDRTIAKMSIEEKAGQCFTYVWNSPLLGPTIVEAVEKLHCGGLRLAPFNTEGFRAKYYQYESMLGYKYPGGVTPIMQSWLKEGVLSTVEPEEYAARLNRLQKMATSRNSGIPLHVAIDMEGDYSHDFPYGRINLFPAVLGLKASGSTELTRRVGRAIGKQLSAIGVNLIHSPVLDVLSTTKNIEIGIRSFSDDPAEVARYGAAYMKGLQEGGLITTGKHCPGRGACAEDAHFVTPTIKLDRKTMMESELAPYRKLIKQGLDSIMMAHTIYPALDPDEIASLSPVVIRDVIRGELGFRGVITTDAIAMGAVIKKYPLHEACARAIQAGSDLVLNRLQTEARDQGYWETVKWVRDGRIPEEDLNDRIRNILSKKYDRGLYRTRGQVRAKDAPKPFRSPANRKLSHEAALKATIILRNKDRLLPLKKDCRVLVIEQTGPIKYLGLDTSFHRLSFLEAMYSHSMNVIGFDTEFCATTPEQEGEKSEESLIMSLLDKVDVVVATNHFWRIVPENNSALINKIIAAGKKVVVVTNSPFDASITPRMKNVILTFSSTPESMRVAANVLYGTEKPKGKWPLNKFRI